MLFRQNQQPMLHEILSEDAPATGRDEAAPGAARCGAVCNLPPVAPEDFLADDFARVCWDCRFVSRRLKL